MARPTLFMIYRPTNGFWSKENGWVAHSGEASSFTRAKAAKFRLPAPDSYWTDHRTDLKFHYGAVYTPMEDDEELLRYTKEHWQKDGELEIDIPDTNIDRADCISRGAETGAYVRAWVWVPWSWSEVDPEEVKVQ